MRALTQTTPLPSNLAGDLGALDPAALRNGAPADMQGTDPAEIQALFSAMLTGLKHTSSAAGKATAAPDGHDAPHGLVLRNLASSSGAETNITGPMLRNLAQSTGNQDAENAGADNGPVASPDRAGTISVLQRHEGELGTIRFADLDKKINDPKTPPDLKAALQTVKNDPGLQKMLDAGKNGKTDGKFSGGDVKALSNSPTLIALNEEQAGAFEKNYIPSDDTSGAKQGRPMTANDAERELYRYSDNLPDPMTKESLQQIVDGTGSEGKRPPQVIAAAQYYLDHPDDWQKLAGNAEGKVKRGKLEDAISSNVELNADESATVKTMQANSDAFFKDGNLTRDKLKTLSSDSNPDVAKAAKQLLNDPMLFGMMDNAMHGNSGSFFHAADDGQIAKKDFDKCTSTMNKTPA
ncbi:MAG TPA: HrpF/NolX family T3SS translocon protein, partial [Paraburkholderia sp.]|nr:HrpF/NolX family T3SS translocon protein [Paraburkholderia sp.]